MNTLIHCTTNQEEITSFQVKWSPPASELKQHERIFRWYQSLRFRALQDKPWKYRTKCDQYHSFQVFCCLIHIHNDTHTYTQPTPPPIPHILPPHIPHPTSHTPHPTPPTHPTPHTQHRWCCGSSYQCGGGGYLNNHTHCSVECKWCILMDNTQYMYIICFES